MLTTVVVLYGPKAAGKSQIARILRDEHGVTHVDPDALVLDLLARGIPPHPRLGWLREVEDAVEHALDISGTVSVEATGAWDSDWQLADDLTAHGHRVLTVWVFAPLELTLRRLSERTAPRVPITEGEARAVWTAANDRARHRSFDLILDTGDTRKEDLPRALAPLIRSGIEKRHGPAGT